MRDDLKEELMGYARAAADQASPPGAAVIRRHARRHARRVAALTVTRVLVAVGLGVGGRSAPRPHRPDRRPAAGDQPRPGRQAARDHAGAGPGEQAPADHDHQLRRPRAAVQRRRPGRAGQPLGHAAGAGRGGVDLDRPAHPLPDRGAPAGTDLGRPTLSPDRPWVYYSLSGAPGKAGIYRVPFGGGPATRLTWTVGSSLAASPDGSKLLLDARGQPGWRYGLVIRDLASGRWRTAVSFDARGPVPVFGELLLAWPAPRRIRFVARVAGSDAEPGRYRLVGVDPQSGKLTPMGAVLASDPSPGRRVTLRFLDLDPGGRYLLYGVDGLSGKETRAYESGAW